VAELRSLAGEYGIAIVIIHHLRKAESDDVFDTISGTLGLTGAVDTIMVMKREANGVILAAKGRDLEEFSKALAFDRDTATCKIIGEASVIRMSNERETVLRAFDEAKGQPIGAHEIVGVTGMKSVNVRKLLQRLKSDGLIDPKSYGKYVRVDPAK